MENASDVDSGLDTRDNPFRETISDEQVSRWLSQFEATEKHIVKKLLRHFRFYGPNKVNSCVRYLHATILKKVNVQEDSIYFIPVGYVAKSGAVIAYLYKTQ